MANSNWICLQQNCLVWGLSIINNIIQPKVERLILFKRIDKLSSLSVCWIWYSRKQLLYLLVEWNAIPNIMIRLMVTLGHVISAWFSSCLFCLWTCVRICLRFKDELFPEGSLRHLKSEITFKWWSVNSPYKEVRSRKMCLYYFANYECNICCFVYIEVLLIFHNGIWAIKLWVHDKDHSL